MRWIDTHCHLDMISDDLDLVLQKTVESKVLKMVTIGVDLASNSKILEIINQHKEVYATLGVHPNHIDLQPIRYIDEIKDYFSNNKILAIGECGFDFFYQKTEPLLQKLFFQKQMELALELDKPIVIHSRKAEDMTIETMEPYLKKGLKALFHSFTSNASLFDFGMSFNSWFSFNAIATFPKSDDIRKFLSKTPLSKILIETDSPFLAPAPYRGKTNIPAYVSIVGEKLAEVLDLSAANFSEILWENSHSFYTGL